MFPPGFTSRNIRVFMCVRVRDRQTDRGVHLPQHMYGPLLSPCGTWGSAQAIRLAGKGLSSWALSAALKQVFKLVCQSTQSHVRFMTGNVIESKIKLLRIDDLTMLGFSPWLLSISPLLQVFINLSLQYCVFLKYRSFTYFPDLLPFVIHCMFYCFANYTFSLIFAQIQIDGFWCWSCTFQPC